MKFNLNKTPRWIKASSAKNSTMQIVAMEGSSPELLVMDYIGKDYYGDGISGEEVITFCNKHKDSEIKARFNSEGGDAYVGLVMYNAFADHGNVTSIIEGIAFSAAAIAIAGSKTIQMREQSDFGIHHALTLAFGNVKAMRGAIEWLESVDNHQIKIFEQRTGESREQVLEWLAGTDDGTVFNAEEAVELGFADEVLSSGSPSVSNRKSATFARKRMEAKIKHRKALASMRR